MSAAAATRDRLPEQTRLGTVRLQVSDLARSIAYYESVIGLSTKRRVDDVAELGPHDGERVLLELHERAGAAPVPPRGRIGLYHFAILVPDRATLGSFVAHLADLGARAGSADHLVSEALYLSDPDGLGIEVYADRPRTEWPYRSGELMMATDPLDVAGLASAGADARWAGMPAGTVVGHVHLHVGDLDRARDFYHGALGFDVTVSSYPGALFLSAGGYHHHLGVNTWSSGGPPDADEARLLEWALVLPAAADVTLAAESLEAAGYGTEHADAGVTVADPWGTRLRLRAGASGG